MTLCLEFNDFAISRGIFLLFYSFRCFAPRFFNLLNAAFQPQDGRARHVSVYAHPSYHLQKKRACLFFEIARLNQARGHARASTALGKNFTFLLGLRRTLQTRALTRFVADRARSVIKARAATYRYCSLYGSHLPTTQADPSRSRTSNSIQTKEIRLSHPPRGWPMANQFNSQFDFYTINFFNFIFCFLTFKV